jgi:hypothetical protein
MSGSVGECPTDSLVLSVVYEDAPLGFFPEPKRALGLQVASTTG